MPRRHARRVVGVLRRALRTICSSIQFEVGVVHRDGLHPHLHGQATKLGVLTEVDARLIGRDLPRSKEARAGVELAVERRDPERGSRHGM